MSARPKTFVVSDLALKDKVAADARGFTKVAQHDALILEQWRATVSDVDTVYVLGNFARAVNRRSALMLAAQLPGRKRFLQGEGDPAGLGPAQYELCYGDTIIVLSYWPLERWRRDALRSYHLHGFLSRVGLRTAARRACVCADANEYRPILLDDALAAARGEPVSVKLRDMVDVVVPPRKRKRTLIPGKLRDKKYV